MIPVYSPYKLGESKTFLNEIIDDNWVSFSGKYVKLCEKELERRLNINHVLLTNNGTSATHCLFKAIKWKYPNCKHIYIPNNCFIAVYNTALHEYEKSNIKIIPIDADTWNMNMKYINDFEPNSALILVHNIGNIIPIQKIMEERPDIVLVEDNCEGFMGKYGEKFSGTLSLCSSISFFPNKHITSGEGGAFCTNDMELYKYIKKYCRQGITDEKYKYDLLGQNYRMSNVNACLLYSQLNLLDEILDIKNKLFSLYRKYLDNNKISFQKQEENTLHSNWMFPIKFKSNISDDEVQNRNLYFNKNNIEIRPFFCDYKYHKHLADLDVMNEQYPDIYNQIIILPSFPDLSETNIKYIAEKVNEYANNLHT